MLNIPRELEDRLASEARRQGMPLEAYAVKVLESHLPREGRGEKLMALLQSWIDAEGEPAEEQRKTGEFLVRALDEDRPSDRKLYPPELKGVTW